MTRRQTPTVICRNFIALMPSCTKTSFPVTPYYTCAHRNSDNLHDAISLGFSGRVMADEHVIVSYINCVCHLRVGTKRCYWQQQHILMIQHHVFMPQIDRVLPLRVRPQTACILCTCLLKQKNVQPASTEL